MTDTLRIAARLAPELVALRRHLHGIPELGLDLPDTQAAVLKALAGLDLEVTLGESLSSVVAVLRGRAPVTGERPVVLLRADMDALPVAEQVDVDYVSTRPGMMHACGHDLHMAGLVGAARILHELREHLVGDVVLMFQPAEEGPGGAEPMIREGLLEAAGRRVDAAYAVHVYSADHPFGTWFGRPGTLMAAADEVHVVVRGEGGHGSAPDRAKDPVPVACEIVLAYQSAVTRQFSVWDPVVLTVGRIAAGTKDNIIPDDAFVDATLRTFSAENRARAHDVVTRIAEHVAQAHGMTAEVTIGNGYPVTVNDVDEFAFSQGVVVDLFGADRWVDMANPEAGSEDMSFVLDEVPGAYLNVSACAFSDVADAEDNHSPRAAFDDAVVPDIAAALAEMALRRTRELSKGVVADA
ncbi:M20 family metallopeptidase [Ornithinibacter aureus]|uniref:M20 family metallopeptidase n=1 Tax=Ornithinibacter aureus TaxID=622664 RepID=A0ABP8K864_9MICO|nr:M20 family metallopeptidase [Ornithinibacter aureus]KAF0835580.1 hippurate hydrolase [Ornithinibacter aureus]